MVLLQDERSGSSEGIMVERTSDPQAGTAEVGEADEAERPAKSGGKAQFDKKTIALVYDFDGTLSPQANAGIHVPAQDRRGPQGVLGRGQRARPRARRRRPHHLHAPHVQEGQGDAACASTATTWCSSAATWSCSPASRSGSTTIADYVKLRSESHGVTLRHYLVSSGLTEIIEGTRIYRRFHNVFASEYWFDAYDLPYPKRVITDTGKTQYLFRINKGVEDLGESINDHMPEAERPIPFANMIYFGDGDTDVPSMAVMRKNGGHAIAVHPPGKSRAKCVDLFKAGRCDFFAPADYRRGSELFKRTCLLLDRMLADIRVQEEVWRLGRGVR